MKQILKIWTLLLIAIVGGVNSTWGRTADNPTATKTFPSSTIWYTTLSNVQAAVSENWATQDSEGADDRNAKLNPETDVVEANATTYNAYKVKASGNRALKVKVNGIISLKAYYQANAGQKLRVTVTPDGGGSSTYESSTNAYDGEAVEVSGLTPTTTYIVLFESLNSDNEGADGYLYAVKYTRQTPMGSISVASSSILTEATTTLSGTATFGESAVGGTWSYTSENGSVATVAGSTVTGVGCGTTTLTGTFTPTDNISYTTTTATCSITVVAGPNTDDTTVKSYPYLWDFSAKGDWAGLHASMSGHPQWTPSSEQTTETNPKPKEYRPAVAHSEWGYSIPMLQGLRFTGVTVGGSPCVDYQYKQLWLAAAGTIKIPNVPAGKIVIITAQPATNSNVTVTNATLLNGSWTAGTDCIVSYTSTGGDVVISSSQSMWIKSIQVTNASFTSSYSDERITFPNGKYRPYKGTFTFTEAGCLAGGTVIHDVPGVKLIVGASGDNSWSVVNASHLGPDSRGDYHNLGYASTSSVATNTATFETGNFYTFEPYVNGEIEVTYYTTGNMRIYDNGVAQSRIDGQRIQTKTFLVQGGHVYHMAAETGTADFYLHSFSFTPKFLTPALNEVQTENFVAYSTTESTAFPKLLGATANNAAILDKAHGYGFVSFSGDQSKVNVVNDNNVVLQDAGTDICIQGKVLNYEVTLETPEIVNDSELYAYYLLDSHILKFKNAYRVKNGESTLHAIANQEYVDQVNISNGEYRFAFSDVIKAVADPEKPNVFFQRIGVDGYDINLKNEYSANLEVSDTVVKVKFNDLEEGITVRLRIPANQVQLVSDPNQKNAEIIRYFTVKKADEPEVEMIYPTGLASVGTSIVLELSLDGVTTGVEASNKYPVEGILSAEGYQDIPIIATYSNNRLVFKSPRTLAPNKLHKLTITPQRDPYKLICLRKDNTDYLQTKTREFSFYTGAAAGTQPIVERFSPLMNTTVSLPADNETAEISFTFDQKVELEPYSIVAATPVNGSEATTKGEYNYNSGSLQVKDDGKTVFFEYNKDGLKYDMYYEVVIPANTVIGVGGRPNEEDITLKFRVNRKNANGNDNDNIIAVNGNCYTWDFERIGMLTNTITDLIHAAAAEDSNGDGLADSRSGETNLGGNSQAFNENKSGWSYNQNNSNRFGVSCKNESERKFVQGVEVQTYKGTTDYAGVVLPEFKGLRISMVTDRRSYGIQIDNNKSGNNALHLVGGTHYLTIPNVPKGVLYIRAALSSGNVNSCLNINSNNAVYEDGTQLWMYDGSSSTRVKKITVSSPGDVTFCLQDVTFKQIAVPSFQKTFNEGYLVDGKIYASDCQAKDTRFDLTNTLTGSSVIPYYVQSFSETEKAVVFAEAAKNGKAVGSGVGTILAYTGTTTQTLPLFVKDVNTEAQTVDGSTVVNILGGTTTTTTPAHDADHYIYVLSKSGTDSGGGKHYGVGFYNYTNKSIPANKSYLPVAKSYIDGPSAGGSGAKPFGFIFADEPSSAGITVTDGTPSRFNDGYYYNLNGTRVANPTKGIYIHNGKKIVVK